MASLPRVLLVEDDKTISDTLVLALQNDYEVDVASNGKSAVYKSDAMEYELIILDLNLPDISGADVCLTIRQRGLRAPILILSGVSDIKTKVHLLDLGANDYLTKPFALGELKARLRVLSRRNAAAISRKAYLEAYGVTLDRSTFAVTRDEVPIVLRQKEFELLACLLEEAGKVVSRAKLTEYAWPGIEQVWTNTLDVHINRLRDKLDRPFNECLIHTVHGQGFKIDRIKIGSKL